MISFYFDKTVKNMFWLKTFNIEPAAVEGDDDLIEDGFSEKLRVLKSQINLQDVKESVIWWTIDYDWFQFWIFSPAHWLNLTYRCQILIKLSSRSVWLWY